jgi:hypothetical protein
MVEQQRALCRPGSRTVGLKDDRRKDLHPIGEKLTVIGLARLAGLGVDAKAPGPITGHAGGAHVAAAGTHRLQCLGDSPGHELVVARRLRALASLKTSLTVLTGAMPRLLPWQELGEHVWLSAPAGRALVALSPVAGSSVGPVQLDPRASVFRPRALHLRCAHPRHRPSVAPPPDGSAQRDAGGGASKRQSRPAEPRPESVRLASCPQRPRHWCSSSR